MNFSRNSLSSPDSSARAKAPWTGFGVLFVSFLGAFVFSEAVAEDARPAAGFGPASFLSAGTVGASSPLGYQGRGCGFDLDDDGLIGEPEDCQVCNAELVGGRVVGGEPDPDGDGVAEDLVYVDCEGGRDRWRCGQSGERPCKTLGFALRNLDGPADGAEDIVCFTGTCSGERHLTPRNGGLATVRTVPATGSQVRSFELPRDPAMIVGWDRDRDGAYPPFDVDDPAMLDAGTADLAFLFNAKRADNSYFEMAHFSARDYGRRDAAERGGFLKLSALQPASHLYVHDLSLQNINRDRASTSGRITFNFFGLGAFRYGAFINLDVPDNGGYFNRGAAPYFEPSAGPFRWQNITVSAHSCDQEGEAACAAGAVDAYWTGWKLWGFFEGLEILDSVIDANLDAWKPKREGGPVGAQGVVAAECSVDWTIRNNRFREVKTALKVQNFAERFCDGPTSRPVDRVVFEGNAVENDSDWWKNGLIAVASGPGGDEVQETNGSIRIAGNRFRSSVGWDATIDLETGNGGGLSPGGISLVGNVFEGAMRTDESAFLRVRSVHPFKQHAEGIRVEDNVFCGLSKGMQNIRTTFSVDGWQASGNSYAAKGHFAWGRERLGSLEDWQAATKSDADASMRICAETVGDDAARKSAAPE